MTRACIILVYDHLDSVSLPEVMTHNTNTVQIRKNCMKAAQGQSLPVEMFSLSSVTLL